VKGLPQTLRSTSAAEVAERLHAERAGSPFLLYRDGDGRQRIAELRDSDRALCIGRGPANDLALEWDAEVSRVHAVLERAGGHWTLVDDGLSRNGSFVNGARVHGRRRLADGDAIAIGKTLMVFVANGESTLRATEATPDGTAPEISPAQQRVLQALCGPVAADPFAGPPSNREIADELYVSVETIKSHMRALFERYGVEDMPQNRKRAELARRALARGAITG
jgi:pSer/pThr/pTyr-binding forkhead associated (FHA) protein